MGWGGIDLIPVGDGETPQEAVDRVYEGGVTMRFGVEDGVPWGTVTENPGGKKDPEFISRDERKWMLRALELMEEVEPGWTICHQDKGEHRRWPHSIQVDHESASVWVGIYDCYATVNSIDRWPGWSDAQTWVERIADHFAAEGCAVYHPDTSELVDIPFNLML